MRTIRYLFFLILCSSACIYAQKFDWAAIEPIDLTTNPSYLRSSLALDSSGNPVYSRLFHPKIIYSTHNLGDIIVEKKNTLGATIFSDTLYGKVAIKNITADKQNNIIISGQFKDTIQAGTQLLIIPSGTAPDNFILKCDSEGNVIWLKNITETYPTGTEISDVAVDRQNNIWFGLQTSTLSSFAKKIDENGNESASFTQTNVRVISGISIDVNENVWISGSTFSGGVSFNGLNLNAPHNYNIYVAKYSPTGTCVWAQFVEDITLQAPLIACDAEGNAYISARLFDGFSFGGIPTQGPDWVYDFFLAKIDSGGEFLWVSEIPVQSTGDGTIGDDRYLSVKGNDNVFLAGFVRSTINWDSSVVSTSNGGQDAMILNYSSDGNIQWAKSAGSSYYVEKADAIAVDALGNCFVTGMVGANAQFDSLQFTGGTVNSFLAKITNSPVSGILERQGKQTFALESNYPNPFNPTTVIRYSLRVNSNVTLKVYNTVGQEVATLLNKEIEEAGEHSVTFNATGLPSGIYFYRLTAGQFVETKKLVLMK